MVATIPTGAEKAYAIAVTPDGARAYVGTAQGDYYGDTNQAHVIVIDTNTASILNEIPLLNGYGATYPLSLAISPDGRFAYVAADTTTSYNTQVLWVVDTTTNTVVSSLTLGTWPNYGQQPTSIVVSPDASRLYLVTLNSVPSAAASGAGTVTVLNSQATSVIASIPVGEQPFGAALACETTAIISQPSSQTIANNSSATLSVTATGNGLHLQWYNGTTPIQGANGPTYSTGPLTATATYTVVVSSLCGTVTSSPATVTVQPACVPAQITAQPQAATVTSGYTATFSVGATGTGLQYQWYRNGSSIPGATGSTYTTGTLAVSDNGAQFYVVVTGQCGSPVMSTTVTLTVIPACTPPSVINGPVSQSVANGTSASLSVLANGSALTYQWRQNGVSIPGATASSYTTAPLTANTVFDVQISNGCGNADPSANVVINMLFGPPSTLNPTLSSAEPVNTATGNYYSSHIDMQVKGRGLSFSFAKFYNSSDPYSGPLGFGWTHSYNLFLTVAPQTGVVTIKQGDGSQIQFEPGASGSFQPITTGLHDGLVQNPDGSFTLTRKNQVRLMFSSSGKLLQIADPRGNAQKLTYDSSGFLVQVTDSTGRTFTFTNDATGRVSSITDPIGRVVQYRYDTSGNLATFQDAAGGVTRYAYDASHRLISGTDARGVVYVQNTYDSQGRVTIQQNGRSLSTTFAYSTPSSGITTITDPLGNVTQHVYDSSLRIMQVIDAKNGTTSFTYDSNNNKTSVTNANGKTLQFTYDNNGNVASVIDPLGNTASFAYDSLNNLVSAKNPAASTTLFAYDGSNDLSSIKDALGNTTVFSYDGFGDLLSRTNALGKKTTLTYDGNGNPLSITNAAGGVTTFGYDGIGRAISVTDANGHTFIVAYDALGRRTKATDPLGNQTQLAYDAVGNLLKAIDANGNSTSYQYDNLNNLVTVTDALGNISTYGYDGNNNMVSFANAKGSTTVYAYDALNRRIKVADPLGASSSYVYDSVGNLVSMTDANGKTHTFAYDALNRQTKRSYADGNVIVYTYDSNGNRASMVDASGTTNYARDVLNRVTSVTSPGGGVVKYSYDGVGHRTSLTYPDGRIVNYTYDNAGRLSQVTDWMGRTTNYTYDAAGRRVASVLGNGASTTYSYDNANRLLSTVNSVGSRVLTSYAYVLDKVGNRIQLTDASGGLTRYGYDALNRLISWTPPSGQSTVYAFDPTGNRTSVVSAAGTTTSTYDADDRLLTAGNSSFTYDNNGNRLTKTTGTTTVTYSFDSLNRLIAVAGGGIAAEYQYDGDGNRLAQQVGSSSYQYALDVVRRLPAVLNENGTDGNIDYQYGHSMISGSSSTLEQFYQTDGIGSTADVTDATENLKASYTYDPWGKLLTPIDPLGTKDKTKFTGQALDPQTGLYFMRARYYDPSTGTFLTKDRFAGIAGAPQTTNRYGYAQGNPVNLVDPSGFAAEPRANDGADNSAGALYTATGSSTSGYPSYNYSTGCYGASQNQCAGASQQTIYTDDVADALSEEQPGWVYGTSYCSPLFVCVGITVNTNNSWYYDLGIGLPGPPSVSAIYTPNIGTYSQGLVVQAGVFGFAGGGNYLWGSSSVGAGFQGPGVGVSATYGMALSSIGSGFAAAAVNYSANEGDLEDDPAAWGAP